MSTEKNILVDGFKAYPPNPKFKTPEWVIGRLNFYLPAVVPFLEEHADRDGFKAQIHSGTTREGNNLKYTVLYDDYKMGKAIQPMERPESSNFPAGIRVFTPHENAPDFVEATISIYVPLFTDWLKENVDEKEYVSLDWKVSKSGNMYLSYYDKNASKEDKKEVSTPIDNDFPEGIDDDLPF